MPRRHHRSLRGQAGLTRSDAVALWVAVAAVLAFAGYYLLSPVATTGHGRHREMRCLGQLKDLYNGAELYMLNQGDGQWYPPWLTVLADYGYCGALRDSAERVPSDPSYDWKAMEAPFMSSVLICPSDPTDGREGGRPDGLLGADEQAVAQYRRADIDQHAGPPLAPGAPDAEIQAANRVPTSYLYELNTELCDRLYPPGAEQTVVPTTDEFAGATWTRDDLLRLCDSDGDGFVSWLELRKLTVKGSDQAGLKAWGTRVPVLRCYRHVKGRRLDTGRKVVTVDYGGEVVVGDDAWYR